jgi:hypothetical protein
MNLKDIDSEVLIEELMNRGYIRVLWHRMDIEQEADELNVILNEDEISFIIEDIEHYHDANYGLNWDVIRDRIQSVVRNRENPIHKFNGGIGATLCHKCSIIISEGHTQDLYCEKCKIEQL